MTKTVGESLLVPEVLSGEVNILQFMMRNNMLERIYIDSVGWQILNAVEQAWWHNSARSTRA